jgi:CCR4-NOT transcription complex subunit 2
MFARPSQFPGGLKDYRFGGQNTVGQLSGSTRPQTGNIEEFPPLGRNGGGEIGQDRRSNMVPNASFGAHSNGRTFGPGLNQQQSVQGRNVLLNALSGQQEGSRPRVGNVGVISPALPSTGGTLYNSAQNDMTKSTR